MNLNGTKILMMGKHGLRAVWLVSLSILGSTTTAMATVNDDASIQARKSSERPVIALVLAGGGAKGAAHVGVLQALEEMHIPIDIITGASMGAYVGGLYASGQTAEQIHEHIDQVDWNSGYRDQVDRGLRHVREKEFEDRYQLDADLGFRYDSLDIRVPKGVIQGQNMLRLIRQAAGHIPRLNSFDELPIRYRAVATDIVNLEPFILDSGYLVDAFMASMSVPSILPPYEVDGHILVDGGVTNNMPVDVARSLGADIVIAVDISTDYKNAEQFTTYITVADQLSNYLVRQSSQKQAEELLEGDIYLKPDVGDMETIEFDRLDEAYQKGYESVHQAFVSLENLAMTPSDYVEYRNNIEQAAYPTARGETWQFSALKLVNQSHYSEAVLSEMLDIPLNQPLSTEQIEQRIRQLYALDRFELIFYDVDSSGGSDQLIVHVREKSWGPNYLTFRLALEDDFDDQSRYSVGMSNSFTDLDSIGSELRLEMEMGTDRRIGLEYFRPLTLDQQVFTSTSLEYQNELRKFSDEDVEVAGLSAAENYFEVNYVELVGELSLGYQYNPWDEFEFGMRITDGEARLPSQGDMEYQRRGVYARYQFDTLDNSKFPRDGEYVDMEFMRSHDKAELSDNSNSNRLDEWVSEYNLSAIMARSFERHTLMVQGDLSRLDSKRFDYPINPLSIGGFLNLSGIPSNSLSGQNKAYASLNYRYRWFDNDFGVFTSPVYLGASYEYGGVWSSSNLSLSKAPLFNAGALFAGIDSPVGPIMFGYGRTENSYDSIYLVVGASFK
ncbi:patatin-like phospholipase family protein [Vibrio sp. RC27]